LPGQGHEIFLDFGLYRKTYQKIGRGFYFGRTISLIFIMRFLIEILKEDQVDFEKGMLLNMGQILSLPFIAIGLYFAIRGLRKDNKIIPES